MIEFYENIMFKCCGFLTPMMIRLTLEYSDHNAFIPLHGNYKFDTYTHGPSITLLLTSNMSFEWSYSDAFNIHSSKVIGQYKCFRNKMLKFEGLFKETDYSQGRVCEFDAVIEYSAQNIALEVNAPHQYKTSISSKLETITLQRSFF